MLDTQELARLQTQHGIEANQVRPLSENQRAMWLLQQGEPDSTIYNIGFAVQIHSPLDTGALHRTLQQIVDRHESLRTTYHSVNWEPICQIHRRCEVAFDVVDAAGWKTSELRDSIAEYRSLRFDLARDKVFRLRLYSLAQDHHVLQFVMHHIAVDGWSIWIILDEIRRYYDANLSGAAAHPPPLPEYDYSDFVIWQHDMLAGESGRDMEQFWAEELDGKSLGPDLPLKNNIASTQEFQRSAVPFTIPSKLTGALRKFSLQQGSSLYTIILSAFQILLYQYSGQDDVLIGTPVHGRPQMRFAKAVGHFTNIVTMRAKIKADESFRSFLNESTSTVKAALSHQHYPIAYVTDLLHSRREGSQPLIQVGFNFLRPPRRIRELVAVALDATNTREFQNGRFLVSSLELDLGYGIGHAELFLDLFDLQESVSGVLNYNSASFDEDTISAMANHLGKLLEDIVDRPDAAISELNPLSLAERDALKTLRREKISSANKIEQHALPAIENKPAPVDVEANKAIEDLITSIWSDVLGIPIPGIHASFFDLGGHSLTAIQMAMRVSAYTGISLHLHHVFENPTIAGLADRVTAKLAQSPASKVPPIKVRAEDQPIPLSYAQERMWLLNKILEDDSAYHIYHLLHLEGPVDIEAAQKAFNSILARHEILRTIFPVVDGIAYQEVIPHVHYEVPVIDLRGHGNHTERLESGLDIIREDFHLGFDLEKAPPIRHFYIRVDEESYLSYLICHHIIFDQWSSAIFWREYSQLYEHYCGDTVPALPKSTFQYADYAAWQRMWFQGDTLNRKIAYWSEQLQGLAPLELPTDRPRPPVQTNAGSFRTMSVSEDLLAGMKQLAQQEDVTLFTLLLALFNLLLMRYTNRSDIAVGAPVANRDHVAFENMLGTFVNLLVIRCDLSGAPTFSELLARVREVTLNAFAQQDLPFEKLIEEILVTRDMAHTPMVQVMFNMVSTPGPLRLIPGVESSVIEIDRGTTQFDLGFTANVQLDEIVQPQFTINYNTDLFDSETIDRMLDHYRILLEQIIADPHRPIDIYKILTKSEESRQRYLWNDTADPYPSDLFVHQLIEEKVAQAPQAPAVTFKNSTLTYEELNGRANQLAYYLQHLGAVPGDLIAIGMEPSLDMLVGLLAIWKAGCTYVPLDPSYPEKRLEYILEDTEAAVLISQSALTEKWANSDCRLVYLDAEKDRIAQEPRENLVIRELTPDSLAYVIHTSGSTGNPKGVQISHQNVLNFLLSMQQRPGLNRKDVLLAVTTLSFDISVLELFLPLISGARVVIAGRDVARDGRLLAGLIDDSNATVMQATPSTWTMLLASGWNGRSTLKVLCGGEAMPAKIPQRLLPRVAELWNMYGPTETTVWSAVHRVTTVANRISVGKPIANTSIYILDHHMQPLPVGVPGELYIGGDGVSRGYLNKPELTDQHFVPDPFSDDPDARLFKTGDSAYYLRDGSIVVSGRIDYQVKIRGFRIELGEIESALEKHEAITHAVATIVDDDRGDRRIVAYYILRDSQLPTISSLRDFLAKSLPAYMIPSRFVALDEFPLTPNRKVDRNALPRPDHIRPNLETSRIPPVSETEIKLAEIWCDLLRIDEVGITDNFFELGGHSLLAVRLFIQVRNEFGVNLPLISLFEDPTIEHLAYLINDMSERQEWSSLVPLTIPKNHQKAFYGVHGLTGDVYWFESLANYMGPDQPFYGLQSPGLDGVQEPLGTIEELAERYINEIQIQQPDGPYYLGGYSLGANIAYEMAVQLEQQGQEVALLALIDHMPANSDYFTIKWNFRFLKNLLLNLPYRLQDIRELNREDFLARVLKTIRGLNKRIRRRLTGDVKKEQLQVEAHDLVDNADLFPEQMQRIIESNHRAWQAYHPRRYSGHVTLLRARGGRLFCSHDPEMGWGKLADGGVTVYEIPGSHLRIFEEPYVQILAETLSRTIKSAQEKREE